MELIKIAKFREELIEAAERMKGVKIEDEFDIDVSDLIILDKKQLIEFDIQIKVNELEKLSKKKKHKNLDVVSLVNSLDLKRIDEYDMEEKEKKTFLRSYK